MIKVWIDTETTGLDETQNGIIEVAMVVQGHKDQIIDSLCLTMKPFKRCKIEDTALAINGYTREQIKGFKSEKKQVAEIIKFLQKNQIKYSTVAGYNVPFDIKFVEALFERHGISWFTYFNYYDVDTYALVKILNLHNKNKKLGSICELMGVDLTNAHSALDDIKATIELHKKIVKKYMNAIT